MGPTRVCALVIAAAALYGAQALARQSSGALPQTREAAPTPKGTAVIAGTLVASDTGGPVRGAQVSLGSLGFRQPLQTTSDDHGAFAFADLAAGRYELSASRIGFVAASYGERRPGSGRRGAPIVLADNQRLEQLTLVMPRAGVLTGVVLDEFGEPALGVTVQARRFVTAAGRRTLVATGTSQVDDRGTYRIFPLPPGEYVVAVVPPPPASRNETLQLALAAEARLRAVEPGSLPMGIAITQRLEPDGPAAPGYVTTFYPGTHDALSATSIPLSVGEERSGLNLRMQRVMLARVSGTVRDMDGRTALADVQFGPTSRIVGGDSRESGILSKPLDAEGRFSFSGVAPGQYSIAVRGRFSSESVATEIRWALEDIAVSGANVDGVALTLQGTLTVSGAIVADTGALPALATSVMFTPVPESRFLGGPGWLRAAPVGADGRFAASILAPGRYTLTLANDVPGWHLASAIFGGRDALDFFLDVKPGENPAGVLTLTNRDSELSGTLSGDDHVSIAPFTVVVFAADERYWLPENRRNRAATPDEKGGFVFKNLPPGAYRLAVVDDYDATAGIDASLLRLLAAAPTLPVTLTTGEHKVQDLKIK